MKTTAHPLALTSSPRPSETTAVLQRCACGGKKGPSGECAECRRKRLAHEGSAAPRLQRALRVGAPDDRFEREADRLAAAAVADVDTPTAAPVTVQRLGAAAPGGSGPRAEAGMEAPGAVHGVLASPGRPLDEPTRQLMESRLGHDFSHVRVHTDARAAASARDVGARAYTVGRDVAFGAGEYRPGSTDGRRLLAHELVHTLQQQGERSLQRGIPGGPPAPARVTPCGSFAVNMTTFKTGVEGTIKFQPDAAKCPTCSKIRLVQIVRVFEKPGQDYVWSGGEAPREKVKTAEDTTKGVLPNYFVDHSAPNCSKGAGCSAYYRDHWANPANSQDGSNDGTTAKAASLWDRPSGDADDVFQFETCARCDGDGSYFKCVTWGFSADSSGKATLAATSEHAAPSATFRAAIGAFDKYYGNP